MPDEPERVSATEANRNFSQLFRRAKEGKTIIVTDRGEDAVIMRTVERVSDAEQAAREVQRQKAREELFARLRRQKPRNLGKFDRNALYDDIVE